MNDLKIDLKLDRVHCHDEGDGPGNAEPYLWTVFWKVDGETVVVNSDGPSPVFVQGFLLRPLEDTSPADFEDQIAVNLRAAFLVARAFLPAMRRAGRGTFISIGSVADHVGFPENAAYAAGKYGLRGLHETLVAESDRASRASPTSTPCAEAPLPATATCLPA